MRYSSTSFVLLLWVASVATGADAPTFTTPPKAVRHGDAVRIEFAVNQATDVAVFVEDAKGGVVRHLVAGALGETAPKPLQPRSLAQSILWDGNDDLGEPVDRSRGPFRASQHPGSDRRPYPQRVPVIRSEDATLIRLMAAHRHLGHRGKNRPSGSDSETGYPGRST